ncbi:MAG: glycosyltransferase family 4 protein [Bacteroidetes bacterium]|nr:glycosyltransferase family 4 protein [Bacteroidota bacterium]
MRILIFNWQDIRNPLAGGAEVHLHEVFERIAARGHEVTLFCSRFEGSSPEEELNGIRVIREGGRSLFNYLVPLRYRSRFRREGYDLVVDDLNKIPFFTPFYVREPLLGVTHHLFGRSIFFEASFPVASYVYLAERASLPRYKRLHWIVGSPSTQNELVTAGFDSSRTHLIPYGVDHELFHRVEVDRGSGPLIGMVGRLKKYKSIDHLIEAFPVVLREVPEARLVIVGDGDDRPRLMEVASRLGIGSSVKFAGFVSEDEKVRTLNEMDIAVNTSAKEGWGLTVIEANACGTPTVSSNVQGLRDAVVDNETGLLFEYGNREELAEKILLVLRDKSLRTRLSEGALKWSTRFDWDLAADQTMGVIEQVLSESRSRR